MSHHKKIAIPCQRYKLSRFIHPPLCGFHIPYTLGYCNLLPLEHHISSTELCLLALKE